MSRTVLIMAHTGRPGAVTSARLVIRQLEEAGIGVRVLEDEAADVGCAEAEVRPVNPAAH